MAQLTVKSFRFWSPQTGLDIIPRCPQLLLPQTCTLLLPRAWPEVAWLLIENIWSQRLSENIQWCHPYKCWPMQILWSPVQQLLYIPSTSRCESLLTNMSVRYVTYAMYKLGHTVICLHVCMNQHSFSTPQFFPFSFLFFFSKSSVPVKMQTGNVKLHCSTA